TLFRSMDYTPYEGRQLKGYPVTTLSRGTVVWDGKEARGVPGHGQFLRCDLPDPAVPRGEFVAGFDPETGNFSD
ncbi:MAG: dihydropyrimidinase, partial [Alphaproteobacteria bacterium]